MEIFVRATQLCKNSLLKILTLKCPVTLLRIFTSEGGPHHYQQIYFHFIVFLLKMLLWASSVGPASGSCLQPPTFCHRHWVELFLSGGWFLTTSDVCMSFIEPFPNVLLRTCYSRITRCLAEYTDSRAPLQMSGSASWGMNLSLCF